MKSTKNPALNADVIVVGGGAAGMMAAGTAAKRGFSVMLIEKNPILGKKLGITGKGRCNVTNDSTPAEVLENIPSNPKFLYSALNRFTPRMAIEFFESLGVRLKTERGHRVFPESDRAGDIVKALRKFCTDSGVRVVCDEARDILTEDGCVIGVLCRNGEYKSEKVILCTGGLSYPGTGSTGDGYKMAKALGHTVIAPRASLVPLETEGDICERMQGFSLKNVELSCYKDDKLIFRELGEMLFTHFGISGPLVLSASAYMNDFNNNNYRAEIDLKPGLDEKQLDARILRDFAAFSNREFSNSLEKLAGRSMIPVLVELSGIPPETKVNSITKEQRKKLVKLFKAFPLKITGPRPISEAIVTAGGIKVSEINSKTMESKLVKGLYFAGEIIDTDAFTGGYNLQIAWSTAFAAGMEVS